MQILSEKQQAAKKRKDEREKEKARKAAEGSQSKDKEQDKPSIKANKVMVKNVID